MTDWFYKQGDQIHGPVSRRELDFLAREGRVAASTAIREGRDGVWKAYGRRKPGRVSKSTPQHVRAIATAAATAEAGTSSTPASAEGQAPRRGAPELPETTVHSGSSDPTRRQAIVGAVLALLVLLCVWLFWDPSAPGGTSGATDSAGGGSSQSGPDSGEASDADETGDSESPAEPAMAAADGGSAEDAAAEQQAGQPSDQQGTASETETLLAGADGDGGESQASPSASTEAPPDEALLVTETASGQDAAIPGDPLSKFTISAPGEATFFGLKASGRRFAFVVDCSGSMSGVPLRRAKDELLECLDSLPPHVEATVVFFDDGAHPFPGGYTKLSRRGAASLENWVSRVTVGGGTNVNAGMQHAFAGKTLPDAVFLLTDGQFDPGSPEFIRQLNAESNVRINTVAFLSRSGEALLRRIADENNGDYRFVP